MNEKIRKELDNAISIVFYITNKCNLRCWHCYNNSSFDSTEANEKEIIKVAEILSKTHCKNISISGGEPTVEYDILNNIATKLYSTGRSLTLMSNGLFLPNNKIQHLSLFDRIQLSIDCPEKEYGKNYKGDECYGEKEIKAIDFLNMNKIPYIVTHVPNSGNYNISSYYDSLGIESSILKIQLPFDKGRAKLNHQFFISESQLNVYLDNLSSIHDRHPNLNISIYLSEKDTEGHYSVNYHGDVFTGLFDRIYVGNILEP